MHDAPAFRRSDPQVDDPVVVEAEHDALALVDGLDGRDPRLAVVPPEHAAATWPRIELDVVRKPFLEPALVCQRLPDLCRLGSDLDLADDLHEQPPSCM